MLSAFTQSRESSQVATAALAALAKDLSYLFHLSSPGNLQFMLDIPNVQEEIVQSLF